MKNCPHCSGGIQDDAVRCQWCGRALTDTPRGAVTSASQPDPGTYEAHLARLQVLADPTIGGDLPAPPDAAPPGPKRPSSVTAAAGVEIVFGSAAILVGLLFTLGAAAGAQVSWSVGALAVFGLLTLAQGVLELAAGILVLRFSNAGRILAVVMSAIAIVKAVVDAAITGGALAVVAALLRISARAFVVVVLFRHQVLFRELPAREQIER